MTRKTGFTLIELLVVIAIIAILAAIIFPVFMRTKEAAYRSGDMSNLNAIRNALQLYRADQEAYPPQILGYASVYMSGPQTGQLIPATALQAALYPRRLDSVDTMKPAYDHVKSTDMTAAQWPVADPRPTFSAPILDLDGNGQLDNNDDLPQARQLYGPGLYFCSPDYQRSLGQPSCEDSYATADTTTALNGGGRAAPFYQVSGYDVADVKVAPLGQPDRWEIHYTLRWSSYALSGGNRQDDPRQLVYSDPPDSTVVTWDSWFRDYDAGNVPQHERADYVLFLGGGAKTIDSVIMANTSWRVMP